jgi:hypothetical protein
VIEMFLTGLLCGALLSKNAGNGVCGGSDNRKEDFAVRKRVVCLPNGVAQGSVETLPG